MSTIFDIRNLRLPQLSRASVVIGSLVVVLALAAGIVGVRLYQKLTNNTVVAYFTQANALYVGDKVQIMGLPVGSIDKIEPAGDKMKVTFHYQNKYKVPANASAVRSSTPPWWRRGTFSWSHPTEVVQCWPIMR